MTQGELLSEEVIMASPEVYLDRDPSEAIEALANNPGKMLTLLALAKTSEPSLTRAQLARQLDALQTESPPWTYIGSKTVAYSYCQKTLAPAGLVAFDVKPSSTTDGIVESTHITPYGREVGVAVAGAFLSLELQHPDISLQQILGSSRRNNIARGSNTRVALYEKLIDREGGTLSAVDLSRQAGIEPKLVIKTVQELQELGILEVSRINDPSQRVFTITSPDATRIHEYLPRMSERSAKVVKVILSLQKEGTQTATGTEIIAALKTQLPDMSTAIAWRKFLRWAHAPDRQQSFVHEELDGDSTQDRTRIQISSAYYPVIRQLLQIRSLLAEGPQKNDSFFTYARAKAMEIIANPEWVTQLVVKSREHSPNASPSTEWHAKIEELVPLQGITAKELHQLVRTKLDKVVTYGNFRSILNTLNGIEVDSQKDGKRVGYITLKNLVFSEEWQEDAECRPSKTKAEKRVPKVDPKMPFPELFFPPGTEGPSLEQTDEAKSHCAKCVVRLACLKTALERGETFGVWGGTTDKEREDMSREDRDRIKARVQIGEA